MEARTGVAKLERVVGVNILTTTPLWRRPTERLGFRVARTSNYLAWAARSESLRTQLQLLNFLHTGRWLAVGRFPRVHPDQPAERRRRRWTLFTANFDGDWGAYVRGFMEGMPEGVYDIWGQAIGWPGFPAPRTARRLEGWVNARTAPSQHYYAAYPQATANDVRSAVRVRRELHSVLIDLATRRPAPTATATGAALDALAVRIQHCVGPIPAPPATGLTRPAVAATGTITGMSALFPVLPGREGAIRQALAELPGGNDSPWRRVPGVHFARLALLDRFAAPFHREQPMALRSSYLLAAADADARADPPGRPGYAHGAFFADVYRHLQVEVDSVWRHCWGFVGVDDPDEFARLARRARVPSVLEHVDDPGQSLAGVLAALDTHAEVCALVAGRRPGTPVALPRLRRCLTPALAP